MSEPVNVIVENLRVIRHEIETPDRGHDKDGSCCQRARITPLPDESSFTG